MTYATWKSEWTGRVYELTPDGPKWKVPTEIQTRKSMVTWTSKRAQMEKPSILPKVRPVQ